MSILSQLWLTLTYPYYMCSVVKATCNKTNNDKKHFGNLAGH